MRLQLESGQRIDGGYIQEATLTGVDGSGVEWKQGSERLATLQCSLYICRVQRTRLKEFDGFKSIEGR